MCKVSDPPTITEYAPAKFLDGHDNINPLTTADLSCGPEYTLNIERNKNKRTRTDNEMYPSIIHAHCTCIAIQFSCYNHWPWAIMLWFCLLLRRRVCSSGKAKREVANDQLLWDRNSKYSNATGDSTKPYNLVSSNIGTSHVEIREYKWDRNC